MMERALALTLLFAILAGALAGCASQPTPGSMAEAQREIDEANKKAGAVQDPI